MPTFNADSLFEPIDLVIDGNTYRIEKITQGMMNQITQMAEEKDTKDGSILSRQLAVFLGKPEGEFADADVRKLSQVIRFLVTTLGQQLGNLQAEGTPTG